MVRPRAPLSLLPAALAALLLVLVPPASWGEETEAEEPQKPRTVVVKRRPFHTKLALTGTFVPSTSTEVAYEPIVYGGKLEVEEAVGPGRVVAGQTLVRLDDETIAEDLRQKERDLLIARTRLKRQEDDARFKREAAEIKGAQLESRHQRAAAALERFRTRDKPLRIEQAEHNLEGTENRIADEVEELQQLEKMYEADDLTEETEEIVLRRTRRNLARMRRSFGFAKKRHETFLTLTLPHEEEDLVLDLRKKKNDHEAFVTADEADRRQAELELEKARDAFARQERALRELREDREALRLRAPVDGYAVPGAFVAGKWKDVEATRRALTPGGRLKARQVAFTIVRPGDVAVHATVGEADLRKLKLDQRVEVRPGVDPDRTLDGVVVEILPVGSGGKYPVRIALRETAKDLMPGQSCKLHVLLRTVEDALVVPAASIAKDGDKHVAHLWRDGETVAREVQVGATTDGRTEVLEGLEEGQEVLATPPKEGK